MIKKDLIDALKAFNIKEEEMAGLTMDQLAQKLSEVRKEKEKKDAPPKPENLKVVEITRSYSRKVNLGNYQSEDYFCSQKAEVVEGDDIHAVSAWLAYQCKVEVESSIKQKSQSPF
jgi:hypothetical protein